MASKPTAVVGKLFGRRLFNERVAYLNGQDLYSWEPAENVDQYLIQQYEDECKKHEQLTTSGCSSVTGNECNAETNDAGAPSGSNKLRDATSESDNASASDVPSPTMRKLNIYMFENDWEAEKILGVVGPGIFFVIKFKDIADEQLVPIPVANVAIPQMVIKFYEGRLFPMQDADYQL